jgi:hypothetical protein
MLGVMGHAAADRVPSRPVKVDLPRTGVLLVALAGAWLAHNIEYLRIFGVHRFAEIAVRSVHVYMGPTGLALVVAGLAGVHATTRLARRLERQLSGGPEPGAGLAGTAFSIPALVGVVWVLQSALYLVQENVEAVVTHHAAPGLGAVAGVHALALFVHLAVTLFLVAAVCLVRARVTELAAAVRALAVAWPSPADSVTSPAARRQQRTWTPAERFGATRWSRPPPPVLA